MGDDLPESAHSIHMMKHVLDDVWDGLFVIDTEENYGALTVEQLHAYDLVVNYAEFWDRKGTKNAAGSLVSYVADGGSYLAVHNGLCNGDQFELDCLIGARFLESGEPCFMEFRKTELEHPVTAYFQAFHAAEEPMFVLLDPLSASEVLVEIPYAAAKLPAVWCRRYGWGKVFCVSPGHQAETFLPFLSKIIYRAGLWFLNRI